MAMRTTSVDEGFFQLLVFYLFKFSFTKVGVMSFLPKKPKRFICVLWPSIITSDQIYKCIRLVNLVIVDDTQTLDGLMKGCGHADRKSRTRHLHCTGNELACLPLIACPLQNGL